ncbi:MAG: hypothetical protein NTW49_08160 [Bacteroidia bacterium]|nr:hypothetical protein [Bacteroidia bacterium]
MKIRTIIPFLLTLCFIYSCSNKIYDSLNWQGNKVTADGKIPEWSNPLRFYDDKCKINYTISNDRRNLYFCLKVIDESTQIKILRGGMEFRVDTLGKKNFPIAFIFPISNQLMSVQHNKGENQTEKGYGEKSDRSSIKQKLISQANDFQLVGFKSLIGGIQSLFNNQYGISAAINIDSLGIMYYEAIIPFITFYKKELTPSDTSRIITYEIKVNALPEPEKHEDEGSGGNEGGGSHGGVMSGGMGGGGHRGGGGGMHGGGSRGGGGHANGNSALYDTNKIINKLKFSYK